LSVSPDEITTPPPPPPTPTQSYLPLAYFYTKFNNCGVALRVWFKNETWQLKESAYCCSIFPLHFFFRSQKKKKLFNLKQKFFCVPTSSSSSSPPFANDWKDSAISRDRHRISMMDDWWFSREVLLFFLPFFLSSSYPPHTFRLL
jgi:hypothetical protein